MTANGQAMTFLDTEQAAKQLDLSPRTVRRLCENQELQALRIADRWAIPTFAVSLYQRQVEEE